MCSQSGSTSAAVVKGLTLFAVAAAEEIFLTQSGEQWQARVPLTTVGDLVLPEVFSRQVFARQYRGTSTECLTLMNLIGSSFMRATFLVVSL